MWVALSGSEFLPILWKKSASLMQLYPHILWPSKSNLFRVIAAESSLEALFKKGSGTDLKCKWGCRKIQAVRDTCDRTLKSLWNLHLSKYTVEAAHLVLYLLFKCCIWSDIVKDVWTRAACMHGLLDYSFLQQRPFSVALKPHATKHIRYKPIWT